MGSELAAPTNVQDRLAYAAALAKAQLLPETFRNRPADVLVAMDWGESLGLSPVQSIQSIHVVKGKPGLSSSAKHALALQAGHRLRVSGDDKQATATLWRADDPEFAYQSVWTLAMARRAGLLDKKDSAWQNYPDVMLRRRAVSAVVEQACPEILLGLVADTDLDAFPDEPQSATTVTRLDTSTVDTVQIDTTTGEIIEPPDLDTLTQQIGTADLAQLRDLWATWHQHPQWSGDIEPLVEARRAQLEAGDA